MQGDYVSNLIGKDLRWGSSTQKLISYIPISNVIGKGLR